MFYMYLGIPNVGLLGTPCQTVLSGSIPNLLSYHVALHIPASLDRAYTMVLLLMYNTH